MNMSFYTQDGVRFYGNYSASGSVSGVQDPLLGEGEYRVTMYDQIIEFFFYEFRVTPQGYVVIGAGSLSNYNFVRVPPNLSGAVFEGLWKDDAGYAVFLMGDVVDKYVARVREWYPEHPTASLLHQYFIQLFKNTTLDEILATTPPLEPGTTAESDYTTTTEYF